MSNPSYMGILGGSRPSYMGQQRSFPNPTQRGGFGSQFTGDPMKFQYRQPQADSGMNAYIDQQRLNMSLVGDPQSRINLAASGKYYLPPGDASNDMTNMVRRQRLDMALSGNPQGRIDIAMGRPNGGDNSIMDSLQSMIQGGGIMKPTQQLSGQPPATQQSRPTNVQGIK